MLTLAATMPLLAQEAPAPRFAFFNLGQLVESSTKAKKIYSELETTQKELQAKLKVKSDEGQNLQKQLQGGSLSEEGKEKVQKQLRDLEYDFKRIQEDSQAQFSKVQKRVLDDLFRQANPIVTALAKEQKLQIVFSGADAGQMITWADEAWIKNFTAEVAKRFDAAETAPAGASKPASPATKPAAKPPVKATTPNG